MAVGQKQVPKMACPGTWNQRPNPRLFGGLILTTPIWLWVKLNHQGTADCSPRFLLPGFHFGYQFLTHTHMYELFQVKQVAVRWDSRWRSWTAPRTTGAGPRRSIPSVRFWAVWGHIGLMSQVRRRANPTGPLGTHV